MMNRSSLSDASQKTSGELTLRSAEFRRARETGWRRLEDMVGRVERGGIGVLSPSEATEIAALYRSAVSSLSVTRGVALDRNLLLYLENLTLRAYLVVYGPRGGMLGSMADFFRRGFPGAVRRAWRHILIVAAVMTAGLAAGYLMVSADVNNFNLFVSEPIGHGRGPDSSAAELREVIFPEWPGFAKTFIEFSNFLFRHNSKVGLLGFGLGFMLGVPTIMLTIYNGVVLGAFIALHVDKGLGIDFVGWLSIHGVTEILACVLMDAGGLLIADKILFPGEAARLENLRRGGADAARLAVGGIAMLFVAGIIEGGFRQLITDTPMRFMFAGITALLWAWYFMFAGRGCEDGAAC